jgi:hypothetical protein
MKNVPLLRQLDRSRVVSRTKILPAGKFAHMMIDLGYRAGYTGKFSPYAVADTATPSIVSRTG